MSKVLGRTSKVTSRPRPRRGHQGGAKAPQQDRGTLRSAAFAGETDATSDLRALCRDYGLTQATLARITGYSPRAMAGWFSGAAAPGKASATRLVELKRLLTALSQQVKPDAIARWINRPNPAFEGSTPAQVIERGETDRLWRMIWELEAGHSG